MEFKTLVLTFIVIVSSVMIFVNAGECDKYPDEFNSETCCRFPVLVSNEELAKKIKDDKSGALLLECKGVDAAFKEMKLVKNGMFDKDAMMKHFDSTLKEESWKPVMKEVAEKCIKELTNSKDKIMSELEKAPLSIKANECNPMPFVFISCIQLHGFSKCPKNAWTENKKCTDAKSFVEKCNDPVAFLKSVALKPRK